MDQDISPDVEVQGWLRTLGVESLCQWDVLVFLYRHQTTLVGAEYLACLLGYVSEPVIAALDGLDSLGLVARSRVSQGARLYQFTAPPESPRGEALERLLALAGGRAGRLRLSKQLQRSDRFPRTGPKATRRFPEAVQQDVRAKKQRSRQHDKRRGTWRKAI